MSVIDKPPNVALTTVDIWLLVFLCVTTKVAVVLPTGKVIDVGTEAAVVFELESFTTRPLPAGLPSVIVPVTFVDEPPLTLMGFSVRESKLGGLIVSEAALLEAL